MKTADVWICNGCAAPKSDMSPRQVQLALIGFAVVGFAIFAVGRPVADRTESPQQAASFEVADVETAPALVDNDSAADPMSSYGSDFSDENLATDELADSELAGATTTSNFSDLGRGSASMDDNPTNDAMTRPMPSPGRPKATRTLEAGDEQKIYARDDNAIAATEASSGSVPNHCKNITEDGMSRPDYMRSIGCEALLRD